MWHYKNGGLNKCNRIGILSGTNFIVQKTINEFGIIKDIVIETHNYNYNELVNKVQSYTFYLLNGSSPEYFNNPSIVHMPHIALNGNIRLYAEDVYWNPGCFCNVFESRDINFKIMSLLYLGK